MHTWDAKFCANARTDLPAALDEIDRLEALLERASMFASRTKRFADGSAQAEAVAWLADYAAGKESDD